MDAMMNDLPDMAGSEPNLITNTGSSFIATLSLSLEFQTVLDLLNRGTNPNNIVKYVETYNTMADSGNLNDLAILAGLPTDDLAKIVLDVGKIRHHYTMIHTNPR